MLNQTTFTVLFDFFRFTANIEDLKAFTSSEMAVDPKLRLMRDKLSAMRQVRTFYRSVYHST
jgi:hypothetical protein